MDALDSCHGIKCRKQCTADSHRFTKFHDAAAHMIPYIPEAADESVISHIHLCQSHTLWTYNNPLMFQGFPDFFRKGQCLGPVAVNADGFRFY